MTSKISSNSFKNITCNINIEHSNEINWYFAVSDQRMLYKSQMREYIIYEYDAWLY